LRAQNVENINEIGTRILAPPTQRLLGSESSVNKERKVQRTQMNVTRTLAPPTQRLLGSESGVNEERKVSDLLGHLVRKDGHGGDDASAHVSEEDGGDQRTVNEVVHL
jgi:hypothetical protein